MGSDLAATLSRFRSLCSVAAIGTIDAAVKAKGAFAIARACVRSFRRPKEELDGDDRRGPGVHMLTNKGKYGLKALIHLARMEPGKIALVADIAQTNTISKKFLDTILLDLRNAGFVKSKKGPGGGYMLAKPAEEILIGPVIRTLDGPLAPIRCASRSAFQPCDDCTDLASCQVRLIMTDVRDAMSTILDGTTLRQLADRSD